MTTKTKKMSDQCRQVLEYMRERGGITTIDACYVLRPPVTRLSGRIHDLRNLYGYEIDTEWVEIGRARVKRYYLAALFPGGLT